ncbi:gallidermin/nisin family lantibiotic [Velocimicrobium porci]|uniref:Gallidermin/nisin family lantibiotic n=1 Tax=Velocimicrobium porci TaxID=2606634 RepID=A0A6L5XV69_9FIRM|nr:gallidermin/nisin family lantibiotic [Velocimicrobium porci]MSS62730.1 gallidermin/nisin family lantibiotic [Velocimicrobium porci]
MKNFNDFDLDVITSSKTKAAPKPRITSKSLCTPGCVTGILQTCAIQTATCGCSITGK